jgi:membrane-bound serine protease (ClpP class)
MASQTFGYDDSRNMTQLAESLSTVALSIAAVVVVAAVLNRFLPSIPLMKGMVLAAPDDTGPQLRLDPLDARGAAVVGATGKTHSVLRPAGKAWIDDRLVDVVSDGSYIEAGSPVEVVAVTGNVVVVRRVDV